MLSALTSAHAYEQSCCDSILIAKGITWLSVCPGLVAAVTPLVLLDLLQLMMMKAHTLLGPLLKKPRMWRHR